MTVPSTSIASRFATGVQVPFLMRSAGPAGPAHERVAYQRWRFRSNLRPMASRGSALDFGGPVAKQLLRANTPTWGYGSRGSALDFGGPVANQPLRANT